MEDVHHAYRALVNKAVNQIFALDELIYLKYFVLQRIIMNEFLRNLKFDLPASLVVFLVALPLCLGIALASGADPFAGIISGVIGGIVVGFLSGSQVSVSGPAAGLTVIVMNGIASAGSYDAFLLSVLIAGCIQVFIGFIGLGMIGAYFPNAVIKGMLSAIGLILILKQIPHALGSARFKDVTGFVTSSDPDETGFEADISNTFQDIVIAFEQMVPGAFIISTACMLIGVLWSFAFFQRVAIFRFIPGPLIMVMTGILLNEAFRIYIPDFFLKGNLLVNVPEGGWQEIMNQFHSPDYANLANKQVWILALSIALIASLETLLSIDAADKLDPFRRMTPLNRELKAQGIGNALCGLLGGLPITAVIVRSSANIAAGGRTKTAAIVHGFLLVLTVVYIPDLLNKIPFAALAAVLLLVGFKLTTPGLYIEMFRKGWTAWIPFLITIVAILFTDLLVGIGVGMIVGLGIVLKMNFQSAIFLDKDGHHFTIRFNKDVTFLNKARLRKVLRTIPRNTVVVIQNEENYFLDDDILETLEEFAQHAGYRNIEVKMFQSQKKP
jgi:MFS superfamily sulfate permease-like transporter